MVLKKKTIQVYYKKIFNRYYFITTTISSVGYGDISPKTYHVNVIIISNIQYIILIEIL